MVAREYGLVDVPAGLSGVVAVAAGVDLSLAVRRDGTVAAWSEQGDGQQALPPTLRGVVAVAGGGRHALALKRDGTVLAWGDDRYGQVHPVMACEYRGEAGLN